MTRSRVLWFLGVLAVATPVLLLAFSLGNGLTGDTVGNSIVMGAGVATAHALVRGRRETEEAARSQA